MNKDKYLDEDKGLSTGSVIYMPETPSSDSHSEETGFFDQLRKNHTLSKYDGQPEDIVMEETESVFSVENVAIDQNSPINEGIKSEMPPEARRVLVSLFRQGVILLSQKAKLFESLCRYETAVRRHLSEVYLKLVLDKKAGVAFVACINHEDDVESEDFDDEVVSLISKRTLSLYDTLLLLVLRKHYQDRETSGEQRIVIDIERVESHLTPFLPLTNSTKADRKKLNAALQKMISKKILSSVRGSDDRFEITPVIRYVVSADFLESMYKEYLRIARENEIVLNESHQLDKSDLNENEGNNTEHQSEEELIGGNYAE